METNNTQNGNSNELGKVQTIKVYLKENIDKMLFSELVSALNLPEMRENALREIVRRMEFCFIDQQVAKRIIQVEKKVLENKSYNRPDCDYLIRKNWWSQKQENIEDDSIFKNEYEKYNLQFKNLSAQETLTLSDLVALSAEADYIDSLNNKEDLYSENVLKEVSEFALEKDKKNAFIEYQRRMCFCYTWSYKDSNNGNDPSEESVKEFQLNALNLFYNEMRIVTKNKYNSEKEKWEPYTQEFFERNIEEVKAPVKKLELKEIALKCKEIINENKELIEKSYTTFKVDEIENDLRKFKNDATLLINIVLICLFILCKQEYTKNNMINVLEKSIDGASEGERLENQAQNLEEPFSNFPEVFSTLDSKTKYFAKKTIEDILNNYENNQSII